MSPSDVPTVVALGFASVMLALVLPGGVKAWLTYSGTATRRQQDASGRAPAPDPEVAERIATLEGLGYRRIGETWTATPGGSGFTYVLTSSDQETYALLAPSFGRPQGFTGLYTAWRDRQWLGTLHPTGNSYQTDGLRLRIEKGTLVAAEASHRAEVAAMSVRHGGRHRIAAIADVLARDADYRTRFGGRELRPLLLQALFPVAVFGFLVAFFIVALFAF